MSIRFPKEKLWLPESFPRKFFCYSFFEIKFCFLGSFLSVSVVVQIQKAP